MRRWLGVVVTAVLVTGASIIAAGDGSVTAAAAAGPAGNRPAGNSPAGKSGAGTGLAANGPAKAAALAGHLVAEMTFPAGTKSAPMKTIPSALRDNGPFGGHWARSERLLVAPVKPAAVWAVLLAHKPFDDAGSMGSAADNGPTGTSALLPAPEPGVSAAIADAWLEPWHDGSTLIAAYGFATWLPVRTAAEHLNPRSFREVTVTAKSILPRRPTVTRTFTSAAVISRITAFLDARPAAPELAIPCPLPVTSYQATFKGNATVTASAAGCLVDRVTVNGVSQPSLWDTSGGLAALLGDLLHTGR